MRRHRDRETGKQGDRKKGDREQEDSNKWWT